MSFRLSIVILMVLASVVDGSKIEAVDSVDGLQTEAASTVEVFKIETATTVHESNIENTSCPTVYVPCICDGVDVSIPLNRSLRYEPHLREPLCIHLEDDPIEACRIISCQSKLIRPAQSKPPMERSVSSNDTAKTFWRTYIPTNTTRAPSRPSTKGPVSVEEFWLNFLRNLESHLNVSSEEGTTSLIPHRQAREVTMESKGIRCSMQEMRNAISTCIEGENYTECTIKCHYGYGYEDVNDTLLSVKTSCRFDENKWGPYEFKDCKPYIDCNARNIRVLPGGHISCIAPVKSPLYCFIKCNANEYFNASPFQRYKCIDDAFDGLLPHCIEYDNSPMALIAKPKNFEEIIRALYPSEPEVVDYYDGYYDGYYNEYYDEY